MLNRSRTLGPAMLAPTLVLVLLFFLLPVVMTAVFSMTDMSTATGIGSGTYQISPAALSRLSDEFHLPGLAEKLGETHYTVDRRGLDALRASGADPDFVDDVDAKLAGRSYGQRRDIEGALRDLRNSPTRALELKKLAEMFRRSVGTAKYGSAESLLQAISSSGLSLSPAQRQAVTTASYTGWTWTAENYRHPVPRRHSTLR